MITKEEKEQIINEAIERMSLAIPSIVGNLIVNHATMARLNKKFFDDHPEFKVDLESVSNVIEETEINNPGVNYEDILKKAIPEIKRRIKTVKELMNEG